MNARNFLTKELGFRLLLAGVLFIVGRHFGIPIVLFTLGTWATGGSLATARQHLGGAGTQIAGLSFGGHTGANSAVTEEYDGTAWSAGGALATAKYALAGCGTQTAGLSFGGTTGTIVATTEEYDGTAWSAGGALATVREWPGGCGTQIAGLAIGGDSPTYLATTEEYDGTAWSAGGSLPTALDGITGIGTQTAALSVGGYDGTNNYNTTNEYDGTAWTVGGVISAAERSAGGAGSQTAGLIFGGYTTAVIATTEEYDGTSWTLSNDLLTATRSMGGAGTQAAGLSFGGWDTTYSAVTEEYTGTSTGNTIFSDDFNNYDNGDLSGQNGWSGTTNWDIQGTTVKEGAKAVECLSASGSISKAGTLINDGRITFYIQPNITDDTNNFRLSEDPTLCIHIRLYAGNIEYYDGTAFQTITTYTNGNWYCIEIEWESTNHTARYSVNGDTWTAWDSSQAAWTSGLNVVTLVTGSTFSGSAYFDYIAEYPISEAEDNAIFFGCNF